MQQTSRRHPSNAAYRPHIRWLLGALAIIIAGVTQARGVTALQHASQPVTDDYDNAVATLKAYDNVVVRDNEAACTVDNPENMECLVPSVDRELARRGLVQYGSLDLVNGFAARHVLGRAPDGTWGEYLGFQNTVYNVIGLPAQAIVCADGYGLNVRAAPSLQAAVRSVLPDLSLVTVEEFQLTSPRTASSQGAGWYRLNSPLVGWTFSQDLTDAAVDPSCNLRNYQLG